MKVLRIASFVVVGFVLLVAVLFAVAMNPGVQTWLARRAVADQVGRTIEFQRVDAGLRQAVVRGLRSKEADGTVLQVDEVRVAYSAMSFLGGKRIEIEEVTAAGLVVDLRAVVVAAETPLATKPEEAFRGLFPLLDLGRAFALGRLSAEGRVLLPNERGIVFSVTGSNLTTGQSGQLEWKVAFADANAGAPLVSGAVRGTGTVAISAASRVERVALQSTLSMQGPKLPADALRLELLATQTSAGGDESYDVRLGLVRGAAVEPLVVAKAEYDVAARRIAGTAEVTVVAGQLGPMLSGLGLPTFTAQGASRFTFVPETGNGTTDGTLRARLTDLGAISPSLTAVGALDVQTTFDLRRDGNRARLERLELVASDSAGRRLAEVTTLQAVSLDTQTRQVSFSRPDTPLARVSLQQIPLAWAQRFVEPRTIEGGELSLVFGVESTADGSRIAARAIEPLTVRGFTLREGGKILLKDAAVTVDPRVVYTADTLTADLSGLTVALPSGDRAEGVLSATVKTPSTRPTLQFSIRMQGDLVSLLQPLLPMDPGALSFKVEVEGTSTSTKVNPGARAAAGAKPAADDSTGMRLELARASLRLARKDGAELVDVDLLQPLQIELDTLAMSTPERDTPTARLSLGEVPLAWLQEFIPGSTFTGVVAGGRMDLSLRSPDDLAVAITEPVTLRGVKAVLGNQGPLVEGMDATLEGMMTWRSGVATYDLRRLELKEGATVLGTLRVAGEARPGQTFSATAKGTLDADLGALMRQPALAPHVTLSKGMLTTTFDVTTGSATQAKVTFGARGLTAQQGGAALGTVEASADLSLDAAGKGTVKVPLTLTANNRRSDLTLEGTFNRGERTTLFNGKLTGEQVVIDDLQALAGMAPKAQPAPAARPAAPGSTSTPPPAPAPKPGPGGKDTQPFWSGVTGRFELDLKRVLYGKDYPISGLKGVVAVSPERLVIGPLEGRLKENPFKFAGALTFNAKEAKPYGLTGTANVANLDIAEILRAANPSEKPALETRATVAAKLGGRGLNLADLAAHATGEFELTGTKGVLRALGRKSQTVGAASALVGIVGALRGSDTTVAVAELASALNELPFDQFKLRMERSSDLNLKVTAMELISPTARVTGTGSITYQAGVPIQNQALRVDLQLAGKDNLAFLLNRAGVLGTTKDAQGYFLMNSAISLGGTAAKPDSGQLWRLIGQTALGGLLR